MDYYIDGTIDSIKIATSANTIEFSLLPSSEFLKTVAEGGKMAVFIGRDDTKGKDDSLPAILVKTTKNENGKEKLDFEVSGVDSAFKCLLLEAKNNRNTIRVFTQATGENPEKQKITFPAPATITIL